MPDVAFTTANEPRRAIVQLRVAMAVSAEAAAALSLPTEASTARFGEPDRLWLGPDQWLLVSRARTAGQLIDLCAQRIEGRRHHAVDASAAFEVTTLQGAGARTLLAMGCGLDFDVDAFGVGRCVRTRFAGIPVVVLACQPQTFELFYDRSYRAYLPQWLARAARDPLLAD
jgi:sarcosine oxidase subunit gamma